MTAFTQGAADIAGLADLAIEATSYLRGFDDPNGLTEAARVMPPVVANAVFWQLNGVAAFSGSTDLRLTPTGNYQVGNAVYKPVLTADLLQLSFEVESSGGSGADGFSIGLFDPAHTTITSIGGNGANLGVDNIPGVHVKYEYWSGLNTISLRVVTAALAVTEFDNVSPATGGIHEVSLSLARTAPNTHNLTFIVDGTPIYTAVSLAITDKIRLALAAGTGGLDDNHYVRNFVGSAASGPVLGVNYVPTDQTGSTDLMNFVVPRAFSGVANRSRTTSTATATAAVPVLTGDFVFTVASSGTAGAPVGPPAVPTAPLTRGRWQFEDPVTSAVYQFAINPRVQGAPITPPVLAEKQTTTGKPITHEGMAKAVDMTMTGYLLTEAQYDQLIVWKDKPYRVFLTDDLGRQFVVYTVLFEPVLSKPNQNPWFASFTLKVLNFGLAT